MKYYIISGEKSGDLYGGYLMKSLAKYHNKNANFICWGGDNMRKNNGEMIRSLNKLSFMGFWEVLKNFRRIRHMVFARIGEPCLVCGNFIKRERVANRRIDFCDQCQNNSSSDK